MNPDRARGPTDEGRAPRNVSNSRSERIARRRLEWYGEITLSGGAALFHLRRWLALAWAAGLAFAGSSPAVAQLQFDFAVVGDPGNPCEEGPDGCLGSVPVEFWIAADEVTNAQYAAFLNAVAADDDPNGLYNSDMTDDATHGGIERTGAVPFQYAAKAGFEERPVSYVSFWDALRFANWLHNGQPVGSQDTSTTEDGAYTLTAEGIAANSIERNPGAIYFLPDDDEWYKAAYYDGVGGYFLYPTSSDAPPDCVFPTADPDSANCGLVGRSTDVGSYPGSASPSGTFDQGGNVREWTGAIVGSARSLRGGTYNSGSAQLASTVRWAVAPASEVPTVGFRIAFVGIGAPAVPTLGTLATLILLALLAGIGAQRLRAY